MTRAEKRRFAVDAIRGLVSQSGRDPNEEPVRFAWEVLSEKAATTPHTLLGRYGSEDDPAEDRRFEAAWKKRQREGKAYR